jgi:23S rRNA G2069 N7-methylase RlmK/C1962 C5-methylase RlmI
MSNKTKAVRALKHADKKVESVLSKADVILSGATREKTSKKDDSALQNQYKIIREDLMKLRKDITEGYDIAKTRVEKTGFFRQLLKTK